MLAAIIRNLFLNFATFDVQKFSPDFSNEPVFSHSSFVYYVKTYAVRCFVFPACE